MSVSDIARVEIGRTDISEPQSLIAVTDDIFLGSFIAALKTIQPHSSERLIPENEIKIIVWLNDGQKIEFVSYSTKSTGHTIFVRSVTVSDSQPSWLAFGRGDAKFPDSQLYDWVSSVGVNLH